MTVSSLGGRTELGVTYLVDTRFVLDVLPPCDVVTSDRCGYRDQSYDDAGTGGGTRARVEADAVGGLVLVVFFAVLVGWTVLQLRRFWARSIVREGVK